MFPLLWYLYLHVLLAHEPILLIQALPRIRRLNHCHHALLICLIQAPANDHPTGAAALVRRVGVVPIQYYMQPVNLAPLIAQPATSLRQLGASTHSSALACECIQRASSMFAR